MFDSFEIAYQLYVVGPKINTKNNIYIFFNSGNLIDIDNPKLVM